MKISKEKIRLLGLSNNEILTLEALLEGENTPLLISRKTKISRPSVYDTLKKLRERSLIKTNVKNGKKYWSINKTQNIENELFNTKKELLRMGKGVKEIQDIDESTIIVHKGKEAVQKVIFDIVEKHKDKRLQTIQGDGVVEGWNKTMGLDKINKTNRLIKKNLIISEIIFPYGLFEKQIKNLGKQWIKDFEGRAAVAHEIDEKYFDHAGQIWIFKNSLYLIDMNDEVVIEIRKSEIRKLILSMFRFIQDNAHKFDLNARLRKLLAEQ